MAGPDYFRIAIQNLISLPTTSFLHAPSCRAADRSFTGIRKQPHAANRAVHSPTPLPEEFDTLEALSL